MAEMKFCKNPDYPDDWEEKQKKIYGDCWNCNCRFCGICTKTGMALQFPIKDCPAKPNKNQA